MKKLFLFISLVMSVAFGMKADVTGVHMVVWQDGCQALYNADLTGITTGKDNANNRHIHLTQGADGWSVDFDPAINVNQGDQFLFFIELDNKGYEAGEWHKNGKEYPRDNNQSFAGGTSSDNMKFGESCAVSKLTFSWTGIKDNPYNLVVTATPVDPTLSGKSNFGLDTWNKPEFSDVEAQPWDVAGGLYDPFVKAGEQITSEKNRNYPLASRFNKDNRYLMFCGPLTDGEREKYGDHAKNWTVDNGQETETELYVIDFCEGNDMRGLYIEVPTIDDMNRTDFEEGNDFDNNGTELFYRMGVRFGFIDFSFDKDKGGYDDHLRFVKWGHCFRLNEQSRPLNAFPVLTTDQSKVNYFTDQYGPCQWNGLPAGLDYALDNGKPEAWFRWDYFNTGDWSEANGGGIKAAHHKRGDSRILAERNFWLKRIFLEVAYADDAKKFKRFYIYFDGEYDLNGGSRSFAQDFFVPATGNYVDRTPNIFRGANLAAEEAGFHRFHNLDVNQTDKYLGISKGEYEMHKGEGNYLYRLDFDGQAGAYAVESEYTAYGDNGNVVQYTHPAGTEVTSKIHYTGFDGKFWEYAGENAVGAPIASHEDDAFNAVVDAMATSMIYDPNGDVAKPASVKVKSTYTFPNQAFPTVIEDTYPFVVEHATPVTEFELNVTPVSRAADFTDFTCNVDWSHFGSMSLSQGSDVATFAAGDLLPVSNYVLMVAGSESADTPADSEYQIVEIKNNDTSVMLGHDNTYWVSNDEMKLTDHQSFFKGNSAGYYIHYKLLTSYNFCYPTQGLLSSDLLFNGDEPSELLTTTNLSGDINADRTVDTNVSHVNADVQFKIVPTPVVARGYAFFDDKIATGIEDVAAGEATAEAEYYNLQGVRVAQPEAGQVYIVRRGAVVTKELAR